MAGLASFSSCKIDRAGTGYTLTATAGSLTAALSAGIEIASGPPAKVAFTTQPAGAALNTAFATQPVVTIQDSSGNTVVSSSATVALAITGATGAAGAVLSCTGSTTVPAVAGVATFSGCRIDRAAAGYTLKATSGSFNATSLAIAISAGPPTRLAFTTAPGGAAAGVAFTTQPAVTIQDAGAGTSSASTASVTLALGTNPSGAILTCLGGLTRAAVGGVASFTGCGLDKMGAGYTLVATSAGLTAATSTSFPVTAGPPAKLAFTAQPGPIATYGAAFPVQPIVTIQDAAGNPVLNSTLKLTVGITPGTGTPGAKLTCTGGLSKTAVGGIAAFTGCAIDRAGTGYTLSVTSGALAAAVTSPVAITAGAPARLVFVTNPPSSVMAGSAFAIQPIVAIEDAAGNVVTTSSLPVTLALVVPANSTAALTCPGSLVVNAVAGIGAFAGCAIDRAGTGFAISATVPGLPAGRSPTIAVTAGAPARAGFTTQPAGSAGGAAFSKQPAIAIQDAGGSTVVSNTSTVTLGIVPGTGVPGASLTCTGGLSKAATSGIATFQGCAIDKAGTGYKLSATVASLLSGTSLMFDISQGAAKQLGFAADPSGGPGGLDFPTQPAVAIEDAGSATVTSGTAKVTLAITAGTGTPGAVLSCAGGLTATAVNGVATFAGCTIDRAGTGYTLTATAGSLTQAVSRSFDMSTPVAVMTVMPASTPIRYGQAITLGVAFSFGGAGATVRLEESQDGMTWALVSPITVDGQGKASFVYLMQTSRWFRVVYPGDQALLPGSSRPIHVLVQYSTALAPTNRGRTKTIHRGTSITLTASVRPTVATTPRTTVTFEIYKLVSKKWAFVTRRVITANALGQARMKWAFTSTGTWSVQARAAGTTQSATSPWTAREGYRVV